MILPTPDIRRNNRWFFGGCSSAAVTCITHPLDLLKVHLQTQQHEKLSLSATVSHIYKSQGRQRYLLKGVLGFYNGLSASVVRQLTYSTTRFGIYELGKPHLRSNQVIDKIGLAIFAGFMGGIVGLPADVVNVRMQNDIKLPEDKRRNYKHVFDGLVRVTREEGVGRLYSGGTTAIMRGMLMTVGQNVVYDQVKKFLLNSEHFDDNVKLHFVSSLISAAIATTMTQPLDVLKTRAMNAKPGEYRNLWEIVMITAKDGPKGFFKGFLPAFVRIGPHTIMTFLAMEQLRLHYGWLPANLAEK